MNKLEWKRRTRAIRDVIRYAREGAGEPIKYGYGAVMDNRSRYWIFYSYRSDNVLALVRVTDKRVLVRYRDNSWYANVFKNITDTDVPVVTMPSTRLRRYRNFARDSLRYQTRRSIQRVRNADTAQRRQQSVHTFAAAQTRLDDATLQRMVDTYSQMNLRGEYNQVTERLNNV